MAMEEEELQPPSEKTIELDFARLKSYCLELFDLLRNPKKDAAFLADMADFLRRTPAPALQTSLDYIIMPLLLLLDSAVQCRKKKVNSDGNPLGFIEIRDSVAEGMLMCLEELFKKCYLGSVDQMVVVLKKLNYGAMLSPTEASEEFRGGIIKCFKAMLLTLQPCSNSSCICKQRVALPTIEPFITASISYNTHLSYQMEPQECLLAFLQSQNASAAVGHWLSLLHQAAELEALRGHHGNANIRKEAFLALRVLVAKVGTADALAFFLPGVVSRFTKALCESKNTISGAAGSTGATEHALHGLTEFLITVLNDKANPYAIEMSVNDTMILSPEKNKSIQSVLETLRSLPSNSTHIKSANVTGDLLRELVEDSSPKVAYEGKFTDDSETKRSLFVHRSKVWLDETSTNVDKAIRAAFPYLSVHPSEKVREALVDGIKGFLSNCRQTLQRSKLMLLECLCVLVSDDDEAVSISAREALESLFVLDEEFVTKFEVSEMLSRLIKELPRVVLGNDEIAALIHAQKLLSLMYFAGPDLLIDHLFHSPINSSHFLECLALCLSHNSQYAGSMKKLRWLNPLSTGYLLSIAELKASSLLVSSSSLIYNASPPIVPGISILQDEDSQSSSVVDCVREFPHMPPWFGIVGSQKLYLRLAGILRLTGLSIISGYRSIMSLSVVVDQLLDHVRQLTQNIRMKEYGKLGWITWYHQHGSGNLLRKTSVAVCMLNEIMYGLSEQSVNTYSELFKISKGDVIQGKDFTYDDGRPLWLKSRCATWNIRMEKNSWDHIVLSVGKILHEYLSSEVWGIPQNQNELMLEDEEELEQPLYFFRDTIMLHQVILDGVGIFGILLGNDFVRSGFLHSSLYLLLRNLVTSRGEIKIASDAVLRVLSISSGHASVGKFVVANADYIIDPLCRQLRHLDINPHIPDVLAAMLSYIGSACDVIPLMEEPMRAISSELEVLGRHQHPNLTIPFLKAVGEIAKVSKSEASLLPNQAESFFTEVDSMVVVIQKWIKENHVNNSSPFTKSVSLGNVLVA
ncbi:uncharacterized protein LOC141813062 [Curcuma longa]|uniref:uncharacterized protein LOC141813062 n=1 Tax=Curcuma longa TaxID=136217 RepID=UPI003D9E8310